VTATRVRFVLEAGFLVLVAAACWAAHLSWKGIIPAMAAAALLVTLVERSVRQRARARETAPIEHPPEPAPAEPVPPPAPEPAPPVPEPEPTPEPEEPVPQLEAVPGPPPVDEEPDSVVSYLQPPVDGAPREWNVWDLERIAREVEGDDVAHDQELAYLLVELRQFANADGQLPESFDPVVRESFGDFLYTPA
jgi:hypothetical protein